MNKWEAKERYIERLNRKNMKTITLSEEQHYALQSLAALRHDFHCSIEGMWTGNDAELYNQFSPDYTDNINTELESAGLPKLRLVMTYDLPVADDYYNVLSEEERDEWERKADEFNEENPKAFFSHNGFSLWVEDSWEYNHFCNWCEKQNNIIEKYLAEIDEEHDTSYCPTGFARLK